ncbi:MAG: amidohydrolase family protein [Acidimicrobiales bacterium]
MICDTHIHFYDRQYPAAPAAVLRPPDASIVDYQQVQQTLDLDRVVVVQPTTYGLDNTCQLEAVAEIGPTARAVVVIDAATATPATLEELTRLGVRGARFHMLPGGAVGWDELEPVAAAIAPFGWHIQIQLNGHELGERLERLVSLPCGLVVDHIGRFMPPVEPETPAFAALLALVAAGAHVKLSAPYESANDPQHRYETVSTCVNALVSTAPDRLLWATNWPHPGQSDPPDPETLRRLRDRWLPTEALRHQVLVENPSALYEF